MATVTPFCIVALLACITWAAPTLHGAEATPAPAAPATPADPASASPWVKPGPYEVETRLEDWTDPTRGRTLPVKIWQPKVTAEDKTITFPVMLLSHGLGGSRENLSYLARLWTSRGFVCVCMQHPGSDTSVWKDKGPGEALKSMQAAVTNPKNAMERMRDVHFVLDELERRAKDPKDGLHGRLQLDRIGIAGHSFGAWTALGAGGRKAAGGKLDPALGGDARIRCVVALSGSGSGKPAADQQAFGEYKTPTLHVSGDKDTSIITDTKPADRRVPFDIAPGAAKKDGERGGAQYLLWFTEADHMVLGGPVQDGSDRALRAKAMRRNAKVDAAIQVRIQAAATAFVEAQLKGDDKAKAFLAGAGAEDLEALMKGMGKLERK